MAMEPMTLFSRNRDPAVVAKRLLELEINVQIDGPKSAWRKAIVSFDDATMTLTHDPSYYAEPNWAKQMAGMQNYFATFPKSDRQSKGIVLPTTFTFSLGVLMEPECERADDPRLDVLYGVAEDLDAVIFTPSALLDSRGRILFGVFGDESEDPDAKWPRVLASVQIPRDVERTISDEEQALAPSAQRVARRALALAALTGRAMLEQGEPLRPRKSKLLGWVKSLFADFDPSRRELIQWIEAVGLHDELEPDEWAVLQRPVSKLDKRQQIGSTWRLEGLVVLAWALGKFEIPAHDQLVSWHPLWASLGQNDVAAANRLIAEATLRPRAEIAAMRRRLFSLHWRLRNFWIKPEPMDVIEFSRTNNFGFDASTLPLIENDLDIKGARIDRTLSEDFAMTHSIALERHHAINWIWEGPQRYSEASECT